MALTPDKKYDEASKSLFLTNSLGANTNRDAWVYNFSEQEQTERANKLVNNYNEQLALFAKHHDEKLLNNDSTYIKWSSSLIPCIKRGDVAKYNAEGIRLALYRPFVLQHLYFDDMFTHRVCQWPSLFPTPRHHNLVICVSGVGVTKEFTCLISNIIPDLELVGKSQCYPLYYYESRAEVEKEAEKAKGSQPQIPGLEIEATAARGDGFDSEGYRRKSAVSAWAVSEACRRMGVTRHQMAEARLSMGHIEGLLSVTDAEGRERVRRLTDSEEEDLSREAIFFYTFGALHSPGWRRRFSADLKKEAARIGLTADPALFRRTAMRGEALARLQLWATSGEGDVSDLLPAPPEGMTLRVDGAPATLPLPAAAMRLTKMRFTSKTDKSTIWITDCVSLTGIPDEAYRYVVNGKPALEWVMERVAVTQDKASGIVNDPNAWAEEHGQPDWAARLVWRVAMASIAMTRIMDQMDAEERERGAQGGTN